MPSISAINHSLMDDEVGVVKTLRANLSSNTWCVFKSEIEIELKALNSSLRVGFFSKNKNNSAACSAVKFPSK